jgi:hypothetical protein
LPELFFMAQKNKESDQYRLSSVAEMRVIASQLRQTADEIARVADEVEQLGVDRLLVRGVTSILHHVERCTVGAANYRSAIVSATLQSVSGLVAETPDPPSIAQQAAEAARKVRAGRKKKSE